MSLMEFFQSKGFKLLHADRDESRFYVPGDASSEVWIDAILDAREAFGREYVNSHYWRIIASRDGANLIVGHH